MVNRAPFLFSERALRKMRVSKPKAGKSPVRTGSRKRLGTQLGIAFPVAETVREFLLKTP